MKKSILILTIFAFAISISSCKKCLTCSIAKTYEKVEVCKEDRNYAHYSSGTATDDQGNPYVCVSK